MTTLQIYEVVAEDAIDLREAALEIAQAMAIALGHDLEVRR